MLPVSVSKLLPVSFARNVFPMDEGGYRMEGSLEEAVVKFYFPIHPRVLSWNGSMHAGAITTLLDFLLSIHASARSTYRVVSVDLHVTIHEAGGLPLGEDICVECHSIKVSRLLCFGKAKIIRVKDGTLLVTAIQTMAPMGPSNL